MAHKIFSIVVFITVLTTATSCKKTPGEGGNAQIKGVFWIRNYDPFFTYVTGRYPAVNKSVYLFFGDDVSPGMNVNTNANGEFAFTYLRTGKYRVVAYNQRLSTSTQAGQYPTEIIVNIDSRKQIKDIGVDTLNQ